MTGPKASSREWRPLTDAGNAERFSDWNGRSYRWWAERRAWLHFDATRWAIDAPGAVLMAAKATARAIGHEAEDVEDDKLRGALRAWATRSESAAGLRAMEELARSELPVLAAQLDRDQWLFNTPRATIDLRTGTARPHERADLITKISPVYFDANGVCPTWDRFLERILPTEELRAYVQRAVGYALTGVVREHALFFLYGAGANGKSTFLEVLLHVLGEYGAPAAPDLLLRQANGSNLAGIADLQGRRGVTCQEAGEGRSFDEAQLKRLTGGDTLKARFLYGQLFEFAPTHKIWLAANHKPHVVGTDAGIWRRIKMIPFTESIPPEEQDPNLREKLIAEAPGILAWAVRGCMEWQRRGLGEAEEVRQATAAYRSGEDHVGRFLEECCIVADNARAAVGEMYDAYTRWAREGGEEAINKRALGDRLSARGLETVRGTHGARQWRGVGLLQGDAGDAGDAEPLTPLREGDQEKVTQNTPSSPPMRHPVWPGPSKGSPVNGLAGCGGEPDREQAAVADEGAAS